MKKCQRVAAIVLMFFILSGVQMVCHAAEVIYVEGRVQRQSPSAQEWANLEKGMRVDIGDSIRTARNSLIDIALDEAKKNTIRIDEKTVVILNSATTDTIDRLDLSRGRVYSNLEGLKAGLSFEVTTPSAVAGVRGSSYSVYVERDEDEIVAFKDTVFIKSYDVDGNVISEIMLPQGYRTFIERFGEPSVFSPIPHREYIGFDETMGNLSNHLEGRMTPSSQQQGQVSGDIPPKRRFDRTKYPGSSDARHRSFG